MTSTLKKGERGLLKMEGVVKNSQNFADFQFINFG